MKDDPKLISFVEGVAKLREDYRVKQGYTFCSNMGAEFQSGMGTKFGRVISTETWPNGEKKRQIYCFVAMEAGANKQLGEWNKGDIFKPASWKAPAKHARGNIYDESNGLKNCHALGPAYLR